MLITTVLLLIDMISPFSHLNSDQKDNLCCLFRKYKNLFSGKLGLYPHRKVHIEIEQNAKPVFSQAYPVPRAHEGAFKKELDCLVSIGVLPIQGIAHHVIQ